MSEDEQAISTLAEALRTAFDRTFIEPPAAEGEAHESLIAIEVRGEPYALRLSEVAAIHVDRTVTPLPSAVTALLGVAGFRGRVVPVWDLGQVLGHPPSERPRWMVVARVMEQSVALAFDTFVRHFHAETSAIVPWTSSDDARSAVCNAAVIGDGASDTRRPLVHLRAVIDRIEGHLARPRAAEVG